MPITEKADISTLFKTKNKDLVIRELQSNPEAYGRYRCLTDDLKEQLTGFLCGTKTLPLTYDPFFKKLFNPDIYPERLAGFISSVIGRRVRIKYTLPSEESLLQGTSLLIMDIVVELENGSIANVEIQKISYLFPAQRMSCYSADLLLRQYSRVKGKRGNELNGWLALLSVDSTDCLDELVTDYPQLRSIFVDMAGYLDKPAEVIDMFSEALKILDENTVHYMIEEMQKQIDEDKETIADKDSALADRDALLDKKKTELEEAHQEIERLKRELSMVNS